MNYFTQDTTEGYTDQELLKINAEMDQEFCDSGIDENDLESVDNFCKNFADKISRR